MPDEPDSNDRPARTVPLTIHLSAADIAALRDLAEIYHATPERMAASWVSAAIERRVNEMTSTRHPAW